MKKTTLVTVTFLLLQTFTTSPSFANEIKLKSLTPDETKNVEKKYREGEVIVKYKDSEEKEIQNLEKKTFLRTGAEEKVKDQNKGLNTILITSENKSTDELIEKYENNDSVEYAEPNYKKNNYFCSK